MTHAGCYGMMLFQVRTQEPGKEQFKTILSFGSESLTRAKLRSPQNRKVHLKKIGRFRRGQHLIAETKRAVSGSRWSSVENENFNHELSG